MVALYPTVVTFCNYSTICVYVPSDLHQFHMYVGSYINKYLKFLGVGYSTGVLH